MRNKLILKDADFSANGIYNPNLDWVLNYMEEIETLPTSTALASMPSVGSPAIIGLAGKTISKIVLRMFTTDSRDLADEVKMFKFKSSTSHGTYIGSYTPRRSVDQNDLIFVELNSPVHFESDEYLILIGYADGSIPSSVLLLGGDANLSDGEHRMQYLDRITIENNEITAGRLTLYNDFAGYCPDMGFC